MSPVLGMIVIGIGATAVMDVWGAIRKRLLGIPPADYAMVGRWIGHMAHGTFRHDRIAAAAPIPGERAIGWIAHYAIGVVFAAGLIWIVGTEWFQQPTLVPALAFGIATVAAPFLLLQPGMGRWHRRLAHTETLVSATTKLAHSRGFRRRSMGCGPGASAGLTHDTAEP